MHIKRYTSREAGGLLARLVDVAEVLDIESADERAKRAYVEATRRVLVDLLKAPFGDVVVRDVVVQQLRAAAGGTVYVWARRLRDLLREECSAAADGDTQRGVWHFPSLDCTVVPVRRGYRFELGDNNPSDVINLAHLQALRLVQFVGPDRLCLCQAPAVNGGRCGRVFVRRGRREFCSDRCQKRVYMRRMRSEDQKGGKRGQTTRKG